MDVERFPETLANLYKTTRRHTPESGILGNHNLENVKFHIFMVY